jgi:hypothetical protein
VQARTRGGKSNIGVNARLVDAKLLRSCSGSILSRGSRAAFSQRNALAISTLVPVSPFLTPNHRRVTLTGCEAVGT